MYMGLEIDTIASTEMGHAIKPPILNVVSCIISLQVEVSYFTVYVLIQSYS
jgi:hypothetical protein